MARPQIGWSTLGSAEFIRVPAPAARMMTAGRLALTWVVLLGRCALVDRAVPRPLARPGVIRTCSRARPWQDTSWSAAHCGPGHGCAAPLLPCAQACPG